MRENNTTRNRTYIYTYDTGGNITSKKEYSYTTAASVSGSATTYSYSYDNATWGDLLTSYRGTAITYDGVGNPLSYYNGSSYTFTWKQGRRLASAVKGSNSLSFEYNDEGIRTSKTVNGITHYYQLAGSQILSENWTDSSGVYHVVIFIYDENGSPIGMSYSNSTYSYGNADNYLFVKNIQGDIVHICDESGNKVVSYEYDAWGTTTSYSGYNTTAYKINPFRYRGYYYDAELGLYYLNSRYYDPAIGRFLNADEYVSTGIGLLGYNMLVYCNNSPIAFVDFSGTVTVTRSLSLNATAFVGVYFSINYSYDHHGNIAFSYSYALPNSNDTMYLGGIDVGAAISEQITILDNVNELDGKSGSLGASGGALEYLGLDAIFLPDNYEEKGLFDSSWIGAQLSIGAGAGADIHLMKTETKQTKSFNPIKSLFKWIGSWFD